MSVEQQYNDKMMMLQDVAALLADLYQIDPSRPSLILKEQIELVVNEWFNSRAAHNHATPMWYVTELAQHMQNNHDIFLMQLTDTALVMLASNFWTELIKQSNKFPNEVVKIAIEDAEWSSNVN